MATVTTTTTITISDGDWLHDAITACGEHPFWVNVVCEFRRLDGITVEDLLGEMTVLPDTVGFSDAHLVRITAVLDMTPVAELRRLADAVLLEAGASAEVTWRYELAPDHTDRLGA